MNNLFTPYEQALELKELGFDNKCLAWYQKLPMLIPILIIGTKTSDFYKRIRVPIKYNIQAPLYQQAFKFLREKPINKIVVSERGDYIGGNFTLLPLIFLNKYEIRVMAESVSYYIDNTIGRNIPFYKEPLHRFTESAISFEEAQLACLKKMIQIVRNK